MKVRCSMLGSRYNVEIDIENWLCTNIGDRHIGWDWYYNSDNQYWYIDLENEELAIIFRLKFGI